MPARKRPACGGSCDSLRAELGKGGAAGSDPLHWSGPASNGMLDRPPPGSAGLASSRDAASRLQSGANFRFGSRPQPTRPSSNRRVQSWPQISRQILLRRLTATGCRCRCRCCCCNGDAHNFWQAKAGKPAVAAAAATAQPSRASRPLDEASRAAEPAASGSRLELGLASIAASRQEEEESERAGRSCVASRHPQPAKRPEQRLG